MPGAVSYRAVFHYITARPKLHQFSVYSEELTHLAKMDIQPAKYAVRKPAPLREDIFSARLCRRRLETGGVFCGRA